MNATVEERSLRSRARRTFVVATVATVVALGLGVVAMRSLLDARGALIDGVDPANLAAEHLLSSAVDQETGVRAYLLAGDSDFLEPYRAGLEQQEEARIELAAAAASIDDVGPLLGPIDEALRRWQEEYAQPTIDAVADGEPERSPSAEDGRALFDEVRTSTRTLQTSLEHERIEAKDDLDTTTYRLVAVMGLAVLVMLGSVASLWRLLQRSVQRPLDSLGADAYVVAGGTFDHPISPVGPTELQALGRAMEQMRLRILDDLGEVEVARDELERQAVDLRRSNAELEQFAYVASHDLQEPLRKVASFCQLLQTRYGGQLDERADQYIDFAVDGAKRMQALINDLLAFSRVGRVESEMVVIGGDVLLARAKANLATTIEETGARITSTPLPELRVEVSLAVALLQNLLANAIKFRRSGVTPSIDVRAWEHDGVHEFAVHDDGIGIEPEYADRVFVIFQRLHTKEEFEGTGIGLALCRKIVERHGGRIWIEQGVEQGTTVRFTLPVVEDDEDHADDRDDPDERDAR